MGVAVVDVRGAVEATTGGAAKMTTGREVSTEMITVNVGKVGLVAVIRDAGSTTTVGELDLVIILCSSTLHAYIKYLCPSTLYGVLVVLRVAGLHKIFVLFNFV